MTFLVSLSQICILYFIIFHPQAKMPISSNFDHKAKDAKLKNNPLTHICYYGKKI